MSCWPRSGGSSPGGVPWPPDRLGRFLPVRQYGLVRREFLQKQLLESGASRLKPPRADLKCRSAPEAGCVGEDQADRRTARVAMNEAMCFARGWSRS